MNRRILFAPLILTAGLLFDIACAETIIKDANGIEYFADQIIIKIKSTPAIQPEKDTGQPEKLMSLAEADASLRLLMAKCSVTESKALFPRVAPPKPKMTLSTLAVRKKQLEFEKLGNIFLLKLPAGTDIKAAVTDFAGNVEVEYAEPVYIFRLCMEPNDPLFNQQWYLHNTGQYLLEDADIDAPEAWEVNQGSTNPVIAIIDTGVDLDHPDLINQIWENPNEQPGDDNTDGAPGWAGFDDDGDGLIDEDSQGRQPGEPGYNNDLVNDDDENGYNDDFYGWNWIDGHNSPQDDHGHGTHCAGIAAAETDNAVGIAGVCPDGKIMPLKAFQSSGTASSADIAKAIRYAYRNGAAVISMSFTGPESALIGSALQLAYSTSVLVAAAGNGGEVEGIRYPAYYSYVIGVGATDVAWDSETSSYKEVVADFTNTTNADINAPGVNIRSTLLDDTYASWSGTSMATPVVAGIAGLLVSEKTGGFWGPDLYQGQIVNSGEGPANRINAVTALSQTPEPKLVLESYTIDDSTGDGDGGPDAGETIDLYFTIRNTYGNATGVTATLSTTNVMATVTDSSANYGNIGPSASDDNTGDPITVQISASAANNRDIVFNFHASADNGGTGIDENVVLTVQRGTEVSGVIDTNTIWTADNLYLVTGNVLVQGGVTLTIEPGTRVQFYENTKLVVEGTLYAVGTPDQNIIFTSNNPPVPWGYMEFKGQGTRIEYAVLEYMKGGDGLPWCMIVRDDVRFAYCAIRHNGSFRTAYGYEGRQPDYSYNLITENTSTEGTITQGDTIVTISHNTITQNLIGIGVMFAPVFEAHGNNIYGNTSYDVSCHIWAKRQAGCNFTENYWGTTATNEIDDSIHDFYDDPELPEVIYTPFLTAPDSEAPPILFEVGLNPLSPVGTETVTFTLTFSRPMDTNILPTVSFGASEPYTQHMVTDGDWLNSTTWEGAYPVTLFTGDGLQTIRVSGAKASDPSFWFQIPVDTRFGFEIDTAGLAGVNLQASGEFGRVDLYFNPVDEPDLAGYNVYRSDVSGGPYTKINPAVVVEPNYSDYTAPPGITKYYVVAAVRTDFDESDYSDEAYAAALDGTPPVITHTPVVDRDIVGPPGITIQGTVTDPGTGVASATLYYKRTSEAAYNSLAMNNPSADTWSQNIPGAAITLEGIDYYIAAEDNSAYSDTAYHGTADSPHHIIIYTPIFAEC